MIYIIKSTYIGCYNFNIITLIWFYNEEITLKKSFGDNGHMASVANFYTFFEMKALLEKSIHIFCANYTYCSVEYICKCHFVKRNY